MPGRFIKFRKRKLFEQFLFSAPDKGLWGNSTQADNVLSIIEKAARLDDDEDEARAADSLPIAPISSASASRIPRVMSDNNTAHCVC